MVFTSHSLPGNMARYLRGSPPMFELDIADCPYCARPAGRLANIDADQWAVVCSRCGGAGPVGDSHREAVAEWNNRKALAHNLGLLRPA
jgi:hypothetical protein